MSRACQADCRTARRAMRWALRRSESVGAELAQRMRAASGLPITPATLRRCETLGAERAAKADAIRRAASPSVSESAWLREHDALIAEARALAAKRASQ